jgi:spore coat protein CotH
MVNNSSDTEFDAHLTDRVDVASFARYTAAQNLLLNFDDMAGPGRNYYLWYDLTSGKFTVVGWDYNFTFSGDATQGPHDSTNMRGGFPGGPGPGMQPPADARPPDIPAPGGPDGGFAGMGGNKLKERFLASAAFKTVYEDAYRDLYQKIYASGIPQTTLDAITTTLSTVDGYNAQEVSTAAAQLRTVIQTRTTSLANNEVITRG